MRKIISILLILAGILITSGLIFKVFFIFETEKNKEGQSFQVRPPQTETLNTATKDETKPIFGVYEVCFDIADCQPEDGLRKIKEAGAEAVIITVVDEDNQQSLAYYPSQYLVLSDDVPENYLERVVEFAHKNGLKVYALVNMPHNHWLKEHPDWLAVWSDGKPADFYESDYFHRIVPPSRIIAEQECLDLLGNLIAELIDYGVDGIDINDNFQFSDQYLEESEITLFSSFDDFTLRKFEKETNVVVPGDSPEERAENIKNQVVLYQKWLDWRVEQIVQLFKILKQNIKNVGTEIPLRPHLLTFGEPREYYGLDYEKIAREVDVLYLMLTPDEPEERYFELIKKGQEAGAEKIAASTYLFREDNWAVPETNEEKISKRIEWLEQSGAAEIYLYNFTLIEQAGLWPVIKRIIGGFVGA